MPGNVRPVADERDGLLSFLAQQRDALRIATHGLTEEEARVQPTPSVLSVGGLVKHVALNERSWMDIVLQRPAPASVGDYEAQFRLGPDETVAGVLELYARVAKETEEIVAGIADLDQPVPVPRDQPWFPAEVEAWSVRWVLLHLIEETARHAGHADIIRECVDGATAVPLMAAVEGWPPAWWVQPWQKQ